MNKNLKDIPVFHHFMGFTMEKQNETPPAEPAKVFARRIG